MLTIGLLGSVMLLLLAVIALSYRSHAKQAEYFGALQKTIADAALGQTKRREAMDNSLAALEQIQRQEIIDETNPVHLAERADLDNDWSGAGELHDDNSAADYRHSPAAADPAGATQSDRRRNDVFE